MPSVTRAPLWLMFAPLVFLMLWSGGYATAKYGLQFAEPMTFLTLRYALVVLIMAILFVILRPPLPATRAGWMHLAVVGLLIQVGYFGFCYLAFKTGIAVGTLALIFSMQPILVCLIAPRWSGELISWHQWSGLLLALLGTVVVILARSAIAKPSSAALLFAVIGLIGIVAGSLWEKRFGLDHHPVTASLIGYVAGLLGVVPIMLATETMQVTWNWGLAGALAYLVIGNSVIAVGLLLAMIRHGDVGRVSALFFMVPPLAAIIAWLLLGEQMPVLAWGGMLLAAMGVLLATRQRASAIS